jgi:hypothetical protein
VILADQNLPGFGDQPIWLSLIKVVAVFAFLVVMTLFAIVFERKVVGRMQNRIGPNRVGPWGTLQREEPALAGTARPPVARLGKNAARRLGLADGDRLTVTGATGSISLQVLITEMPDQVVWLPMRSPGSEVRAQLGTGPGGVVTLSGGAA